MKGRSTSTSRPTSTGSSLITAPRRKSKAGGGARRKSNNGMRRVSNIDESEKAETSSFLEAEEIPDEIETDESRNQKKAGELKDAQSNGGSPSPPPSPTPGRRDDETVQTVTEVPDESSFPDQDAGSVGQQDRLSATSRRKSRNEERKRASVQQFFDDIDANGDGEIDQIELHAALVELGVAAPQKEDVNRFFLTGDTISLEEFISSDVLDKLQELRRDYAAQDILELDELRLAAKDRGVQAKLLPDRMVRIVLEFADIDCLRALASSSAHLRQWALTDEYWKPALLKRRRLEQMKTTSSFHSLPEVKCGANYYGWYLEWVRQCCSEDGVKLWSKRMQAEMVGGGVASFFAVPKVASCLRVFEVVQQVPEVVESEEEAPPPPPPELPLLVTGDEKGDVQVRSPADPAQPSTMLSEHDAPITAVAATDERIFIGSEDCTTSVWLRGDLTRPELNLIGHGEAISVVEPVPHGPALCVTGSMDRKVIIWDLQSHKKQRRSSKAKEFAHQITPKHVLEGHTLKVSAIVAKPTVVISASRDSLIFGWGWDGTVTWKLSGHMGPVNCLGVMTEACISKNSGISDERRLSEAPVASQSRASRSSIAPTNTDILVSCCGGGLLKCWNSGGKQVLTKRLHESPIECLCTDSDRHITVTAAWDNTISIFNTVTETVVAVLTGHDGSIRSLHYDPLRNRVISGSDDKAVGMFDLSPVNYSQGGGKPTEVLPFYMMQGPKQPITSVVVVHEADNRIHSVIATVKDKIIYHWSFLADSPFQRAGLAKAT